MIRRITRIVKDRVRLYRILANPYWEHHHDAGSRVFTAPLKDGAKLKEEWECEVYQHRVTGEFVTIKRRKIAAWIETEGGEDVDPVTYLHRKI